MNDWLINNDYFEYVTGLHQSHAPLPQPQPLPLSLPQLQPRALGLATAAPTNPAQLDAEPQHQLLAPRQEAVQVRQGVCVNHKVEQEGDHLLVVSQPEGQDQLVDKDKQERQGRWSKYKFFEVI